MNTPDRLRLRDGEVDLRSGVVRRIGPAQRLTTRERDLLRYLVRRTHRVVPRDELMREVWGYRDISRSRAVDFTVHRLRAKIETDPGEPRHVLTVHGIGYQLVPVDDTNEGPPSGQVTLLAAIRAAADPTEGLAVSERLVAAILAEGGHPARGDGERWLAAFRSPGAAIRCAVAVTRMTPSLAVGLSTGVVHTVREPMTGTEDYRGPVTTLALALAAAGPAGAVLLDAATAEALPPDSTVPSLGGYALSAGSTELWEWVPTARRR